MEKSEFIDQLYRSFEEHECAELLQGNGADTLYELSAELMRANAYMNLTAIRSEHEIIIKHLLDSALIIPYIPLNATLLDVGAGAGFPSLVLAALRDDLQITALDSTKKKMDYVRNTASLLGLSQVTVAVGRAEELAHLPQFREQYDVVTARAVAALNILSELCLPFCKNKGIFLAMKGPGGREEAQEAERGIAILGARTESVVSRILRDDATELGARTVIQIKKIKSTPAIYPRRYQKIAASPL